MKKIIFKILFLVVLTYSTSLVSQSAVGINTTTPNGFLDINSTTQGVVFPIVSLNATNNAAPIVNPNGGGIPLNGTVVYNTNTTTTGTNDVSPGKYYWENGRWHAQFDRKHSELFVQDRTAGATPPVDGIGQRVSASNSTVNFENIKGLTNRTFTPRYTGTYRIRAILNYGAGWSDPAVLPEIVNFNVGMGDFKLTFNGTDYLHFVNSFAGRNASSSPIFFAIYKEPEIIKYVQLTANTPYTLNVSFDQHLSPGLVNDGNSGNGRGIVGVLSPSYVEISFIK